VSESGKIVIGIDPARLGGDKGAVALRDGRTLRWIKSFGELQEFLNNIKISHPDLYEKHLNENGTLRLDDFFTEYYKENESD
jgi:hypothetical protein